MPLENVIARGETCRQRHTTSRAVPVIIVIMLLVIPPAIASGVYEQNFQADPAFTTPEPDHCYWDPANGWYEANVYDVSSGVGHYYGLSPAFTPVESQSFHAEFDINIPLQNWGSYPGVYFVDSGTPDPVASFAWWFFFFYADSVPREFALYDTGGAHIYFSGAVAPSTWYTAVVDYDAVAQTVDVLVTDRDTGAVFWQIDDQPFVVTLPFDTVAIGQRTNPPRYGTLSTVYVDNVVLSAEPYDGLIAEYRFDGNAEDSSGNDLHGIASGTSPTEDRFGSPDAALQLEAGDYIDLNLLGPVLAGLTHGEGTVSFWFKGPADQLAPSLFRCEGGRGPWIVAGSFTNYSSNESIAWMNGSNADPCINYFGIEQGTYYLLDDTWHHVVVMMGAEFNRMYVDGEVTAGRYFTGVPGGPDVGGCMWGSTIQTVLLGRADGYPYYDFHGAFDDLRVYSRPLEEAEVLALYEEQPPCLDPDGDGVCSYIDNCPEISNPDQLDTDGDGVGEACDSCPFDPDNDADGDGYCAGVDNCPLGANPDQLDTDDDGLGDACDPCLFDAANDADNDGVCGDVDTCPMTYNPSQADSDADGIGDACDTCPFDADNDADGDGICGSTATCTPGSSLWDEVIWTFGGDIVTGHLDGTGFRVIADDPTADLYYPAVSPDGTRLAFFKNDFQICVLDAGGTTCVDAPGFTYKLAWDLDSQTIYYTRNEGDGQIWVIDFSDPTPTATILFDPPVYRSFGLSVSNDGERMVIAHDPSNWTYYAYITVYEFATGQEATIYPNNGYRDFSTEFSPTRDEIVWIQGTSTSCCGDPLEVWLMNGDGSNPRNVTNEPTINHAYPHFSKDGETIYYVEGTLLRAINRDGSSRWTLFDLGESTDFDVVEPGAECGPIDNCPFAANPDQLDTDGDGIGDECDPCRFDPDNDADGDGVCGNIDLCPADGIDGPCGGGVRADGCPNNDVDGDEICNDADYCTWTGDGRYGIKYSGTSLGCPLGDADNDTIPDIYDTCAWSGDKGLGIRAGGCSVTDADGDGMPNQYDSCAWQNPLDRFIKNNGCRANASWNTMGLEDPDIDRMPTLSPTQEPLDLCPNSGSQGLGINRDGCPVTDADGDGMVDPEDLCPTGGPTDLFGMDSDGCPIVDTDGDTVPDPEDLCPTTPGLRMNRGC